MPCEIVFNMYSIIQIYKIQNGFFEYLFKT